MKASSALRPRYRVVIAVLLLAAATTQRPAQAGSGVVNSDGTIDITLNLRFPPTPDMITQIVNQVTAASHVLWDASEGQLRFGTVTLTCGPVNEDLADMWVFPKSGRAGTGFRCDGSNLGIAGKHVTQYLPSSTGIVLAHEFGHLALGLGDEYSEQRRFGNCWGYGPCIDAANLSEQNQCLMQQPAGFSQTEFCTAAGHDPLQGDGINCATQPVPHGCTTNCEFFNHTTNRYETTQETDVCGSTGCWPHLVNNFSFLSAPGGLPAAAEPGGFTDPTIIDNCDATDTVLLVLDASGSMNWSVQSDSGEVCGNGIDDNNDGTVDEAACKESRLEYLQAAARGWLQLASGGGVRAGIVSFDCTPTLEDSFQEVDGTTIGGLTGSVNALSAGGGTGIGRALSSSTLLLGGETGATNKTVFLISDGHNTCGEDPATVTPSLNAEGIRVYTLSTGEASDSDLLSEIAGETGGSRIDMRDARALVGAFTQLWARYRNNGVIIPLLPFTIDSNGQTGEFPMENDKTPLHWLTAERIIRKPIPHNNVFRVEAEEGTEVLTLTLAGNLNNMATFGLEASLSGPAGPNPDSFDTRTPHPLLRVVRDPFFLTLELRNPNPGTWFLDVEAAPGAGRIQTGNLTVIIDNPRTDLFVTLDRHIVTDPAIPVELQVTPYFDTALHDIDLLRANLVRPDGSSDLIPLEDLSGMGDGYRGLISSMPLEGLYEVRVLMATGGKAFNNPGEEIFADLGPSNSVPIPPMVRTATAYFFVTVGKKPCRSGNIEDCDGDGIRGESSELDTDKDGIPNSCDPDSDNDEIPDAVEWQGEPTDLDRDKIPDHLDDDADNDRIPDSEDPNISTGPPAHSLDIEDAEVGPPCDGTRRLFITLNTEEPVAGFTIGLEWNREEFLDVVDVRAGPAIPPKLLQFLSVKIEEKPLEPGQALIGLALQAGSTIGPGTHLRVLELEVRASPEAKAGVRSQMCFADKIGVPAQDTIVSVWRKDTAVSVTPQTSCGVITVTPDRTPPLLRCPDDIFVPCSGKEGEIVEYKVEASDSCGKVAVTCTPPSGSRFAPGVTTVLCRAEDSSRNVSYCRFRVFVGDSLAPKIDCPESILVECAGPNGAVVTYAVPATDNCGNVAVKCDPPSGSTFPLGQTIVKCRATDEAGNTAVCSFRVVVRGGECFRRGDSNADGKVDISDGINTLGVLFLGVGGFKCMDASDYDDNGKIEITDAVATFAYLFLSGRPAPPPGVDRCGSDPTKDTLAPCNTDCK